MDKFWRQCIQSHLKYHLKTHIDFKIAEDTNNAMKLVSMIKKVCNSTIITASCTMRMMKANYNLHHIDANSWDLLKNLKVFNKRVKMKKACGVQFETPKHVL